VQGTKPTPFQNVERYTNHMSLATIKEALGDGYVVDPLGSTGHVFVVAQINKNVNGKASKAKAADPEPEVEDDADDDGVAAETERLNALGIRALKAEAKAAGYDPADLKDLTKEDLVETLLGEFTSGESAEDEEAESEDDEEEVADDEAEEEAEDDEEADEAEAEVSGDYWTKADFDEMDVAGVKECMKEEGWTAADFKGKSKADLVAEYLEWAEGDPKAGDADEDEDAEDEDTEAEEVEDDESDEEEGDEDEGEELDQEALEAMELSEVKAVAKELGLKPKKGESKDDLIQRIMDEAGEDDEEEDDDDDAGPFDE
jgi:hypothetical protein